MVSQLIDPLHFFIALIPLAIYLLVIGAINLAARPLVISGAADSFSLGIGLAGFVLVGPMELFIPSATAFRMGGWVWLFLFVVYLFSLTLYVLASRPRIVIYNVATGAIRPTLAAVFAEMDAETRWAGESVFLPRIGLQFHLEASPLLSNAQLIATSATQNYDGWRTLQRLLSRRLHEPCPTHHWYGVVLVLGSLLAITACAYWAVSDAKLVAQSFQEMIHPGE